MHDLADVATAIRGHFATFTGASLELPDGWFGRPYDNFHHLRSVDIVDRALLIGLDDLQTLTLHGPTTAEVDGSVLSLTGFDSGTWEWTPYGSRHAARQQRAVSRGTIRLHSR